MLTSKEIKDILGKDISDEEVKRILKWSKRFGQIHEREFKTAQSWYNELAKVYAESLRRIEKELYQFYDSLDGITLNEAAKHLDGIEMMEYKRNIDSYLKEDLRSEWRKELENLRTRERVSRLQSMQIQITQEIERIGMIEEVNLTNLCVNTYDSAYSRALYEVVKDFGVTKVFNQVDKRKIELMTRRPWNVDNLNLSERIWRRQDKVANFMNTELKQSIALGEDPQTVINKMAKAMGTDKRDAGRLIMTESSHYATMSQEIAYKELDVEKFQFIATLDRRTSVICREMDLKVFPMKEYLIGVTVPPLHPWCRSYTIPYFEDNYTTRFARDNEGNTFYINKNISYKEFKEKYLTK